MKICTRCGESRELDGFHRDAKRRSGRASHCKVCVKAAGAAYRAANPEKVKATSAAYYAANREKVKADRAAWQAANREKIKARKAAYYMANREKIQASTAARRAANPEKVKANNAAYRAANLEKVKACEAAWRAANPDKMNAIQAVRRAQKRNANVIELVRPLVVFNRDGWTCHLCKEVVDRQRKHPDPLSASVDHLIPLSRGGDHTYANVATAHLGCNRAKGNRPAGDQLRLLG